MEQYDFGMIGIGVMGSNLAYNMADHGIRVVGYNKNPDKTKAFENGTPAGTVVKGVNTEPELVSLLKSPRKIMLLVPAGQPVDDVISELIPLLNENDIIIDGGNSHYTDTLRRVQFLKEKKIHFMGMGVSGGEKGARYGPSIMPGGDKEAYHEIEPVLKAVAAKVDGDPCVGYLGTDAAGHYVKMVHNGIEYGIMQLISECYDLLHNGLGLNNDELHKVFDEWNKGQMQSYLLEITTDIFLKKDDKTDNRLVDMILDKAGAKGTGKWTSEAGLELPEPIPTIDMAVTIRNISALRDERLKAADLYKKEIKKINSDKEEFVKQVHDSLLFATTISYAQGMAMLSKASTELKMEIPLTEVVRVWRGGCIIRSVLLNLFAAAYQKNNSLENLLLDQGVVDIMNKNIQAIQSVVATAVSNGYPVTGLAASLNYFNAYCRNSLPTNLVQAQRDYFGAHTYERIDMPGVFHTEWDH